MPKKDYPEFKSWKKLERYCKKTKTKCYLNDIENGAACRYCYIWLSRKNTKKSKPTLFRRGRGSSDWRRVCLSCYEKKEKKKFIFWMIIFIILIIEIIILSLVYYFKFFKK